MAPLGSALLAIQVLVDGLHAYAKASPETEFAAQESFDQVAHLGFDTRHSSERDTEQKKRWAEGVKGKPKQRPLFPG